jgi:hypothetical protein
MKTIDTPDSLTRGALFSAVLTALLIISGCGGSSSGTSSSSASSSSSVGYSEESYCSSSSVAAVEWPDVNVTSQAPKTLSFNWTPVEGADHYRIFKNSGTGEGYTQVGDDVTELQFDEIISVHNHNWLDALYHVEARDDLDELLETSENILTDSAMLNAIGYIKPDDTDEHYRFGWVTALSADGQTLAVGAPGRHFTETVTDANEEEVEVTRYNAGAVYLYTLTDSGWSQQARLDSFNARAQQRFGYTLALSADGNTLAVGAWHETSNATGIDGDETNNTLNTAGAAYVFTRDGEDWAQEAYIKPFNTHAGQRFSFSLSLSEDGNRLAIGAPGEANNVTGIDETETPNINAPNSGAAYLFERDGGNWSETTYIKASNTNSNDQFGYRVSLSADGATLVVGANGEASNALGIDGDQSNNSIPFSGAAYVFVLEGGEWSQQAYIKASNTAIGSFFGNSLTLSADGNTLVVSAIGERSNGTGVNSDSQDDTSAINAGAAYVFVRTGDAWAQEAYVKASNTAALQEFGSALALSADGSTLVVTASEEGGAACGVNGDDTDMRGQYTGAVYLFSRADTGWEQQRYIKSPTTRDGQRFGQGLSLSADAATLAVGTHREGSNASGINGDRFDTSLRPSAGAVFLY